MKPLGVNVGERAGERASRKCDVRSRDRTTIYNPDEKARELAIGFVSEDQEGTPVSIAFHLAQTQQPDDSPETSQ